MPELGTPGTVGAAGGQLPAATRHQDLISHSIPFCTSRSPIRRVEDWRASCRVTLGGSGRLRWTDYGGAWFPHTPPGVRREDRTRTLSASVHHRRFTLYGFSPELVVTNEERRTNAQLYDYRKNAAELRFVRQF